MLSHTITPNATLRFATLPTPIATGRNAPTANAFSTGKVETDATFTAGVFIRPMSFGDSRARAILPNSIDFSSGQVWAGQWRLNASAKLPAWIVDGLECSVTFADGKPMTGVFYKVPGRSEWADSSGLGPQIVLHVKRSN
jgi:hypothetical protein